MVAKISSIYISCYLGFLLPYGLPNQLPYPLVVGGSAPSSLLTTDKRYSSTVFQHRSFIDPGGAQGEGALCLLHGSWLNFTNWGGETSPSAGNCSVWPFVSSDYNAYQTPNDRYKSIEQNIDGSYPLFPAILVTKVPNKNFFGELQGCFGVPGFGLAAEDTIVISGKTYLVVQNVFRTTTIGYWALLLE